MAVTPQYRSSFYHFIRLFLPVIAVIFLTLLSISFWYQYENDKRGIITKLDTLSSTYSLLLAEPIVNNDIATIDSYIASLLSDPDIVLLHIIDEQGKVLHHFGELQDFDPDNLRQITLKYANEESLFRIGKFRLGISLERLHKNLLKDFIVQLILFLALILTTSLMIMGVFDRVITQPMNALTRAIQGFLQHREIQDVNTHDSREFQLVADNFKEMQIRLIESQQQLETAFQEKSRALYAEQESHLKTSRDLFLTRNLANITLRSLSEAIITIDQNHIVNSINPASEHLIHIPIETAIGSPVDKVIHLADNPQAGHNHLLDWINSNEDHLLLKDILLLSHNNEQRIVEIHASRLYGMDNEPIGISFTIRDITESKKLEEKLSYEAMHDPLTGLFNRRAYELRASEYIADAQATQNTHTLCYIDLDRFKVVNDTCGHSAGDDLLRQITDEIKSCVRNTDHLARLGGDEFAILLFECSLPQAEKICRKILEKVNVYSFHWDKHVFHISCSIGIVEINQHTVSSQNLLRQADTACYLAKEKGRNQFYIHHKDDDHAKQHSGEIRWVNEVSWVLEHHQLEVWAQAIVPTRQSKPQLWYEMFARARTRDGVLH